MKKIGINLIIGFIITITLIIVNIIVIKPNYSYVIVFDGKPYVSQDASTFNFQDEVISFSQQDKKLTIDAKIEKSKKTLYEEKVVYLTDTGYAAFAIEGESGNKTFDANITFTESIDTDGKKTYTPAIKSNSVELSYDEMMICYRYVSPINAKLNDDGMVKTNNDKINVTAQKVICSILSLFIGFILSFLAYPRILYEKIEENKKLAIISISMTLVLCLSSGFYIFFTLK